MSDMWTVQRALDWCRGYLEHHDDPNPRLSAEWLLSAATGLSRVELYAYYDRPLSEEERSELREGLRRRGRGEPLQYVTGEAAFRHIVVKTAHGVLIPRPETELLVQEVLDRTGGASDLHVLEVGTGTGCIACSLAKEAGASVVATDVSEEACECARRNVEALYLESLVDIVETDCARGIAGPFDVLVSNPPYIPSAVVDELDDEVKDHEPRLALDGGEGGLAFFDRLLGEALPLLREGGLFACELYEESLDEAKRRLESAGAHDVVISCDLTGRPRILTGTR